ncbi:Hypothetical protein CAP_0495 [Chondromyces apiculatus DSM 436]|uniref:Uncharacterized protein n=1 Tax=Chondromyces apiculatus DSM 436 TaxID=1192034 RepID=A0A017SWB1_9BACT|nr:FG-GAP repeat protein [Chondromyces apiculatus]EYF00566.1 Hypothetical protein CAP_0495 [Chondromyces apiculatus DSM 436]
MTEWYVNGPLGIEQGFTVQERPCAARAGAAEAAGGEAGEGLVIEVGIEGDLSAGVSSAGGAGDALSLRDASGHEVLRYTDLHVVDAAGKVLPARLALVEGTVAIHVDDAGATYPVVVDPLVWVEQQKLLEPDGSSQVGFGRGLVLQGDTAVATRFTDQNGALEGAAYVFARAGGFWAPQQELIPSDAASGAKIGLTVALSGDTLAVTGRLPGSGLSRAVYVFVRSGDTWVEQQKVLRPSTAVYSFGDALALDGDTRLVGDYSQSTPQNGAWVETQKLIPPTPRSCPGSGPASRSMATPSSSGRRARTARTRTRARPTCSSAPAAPGSRHRSWSRTTARPTLTSGPRSRSMARPRSSGTGTPCTCSTR